MNEYVFIGLLSLLLFSACSENINTGRITTLDKECIRLGYDKHERVGFDHYCIVNNTAIDIVYDFNNGKIYERLEK